MDPSSFKRGLLVAGLMAVLAALLPFLPALRVEDAGDIALGLPELVGGYVGHDMLFCQRETCLAGYRADDLGTVATCPACGGGLDKVSLGERRLLPADTRIVRKAYADGLGRSLTVSIVQNGREQKSIHRPQQCLPAQGQVIESARVVTVNTPGRPPLAVMWLSLRPVAGSGKRSCYAYWFAGGGHETPYHWERLFWMSADMLLHNVASRWSYVAVHAVREDTEEATIQSVGEFIASLRPQLERPRAGGGAACP